MAGEHWRVLKFGVRLLEHGVLVGVANEVVQPERLAVVYAVEEPLRNLRLASGVFKTRKRVSVGSADVEDERPELVLAALREPLVQLRVLARLQALASTLIDGSYRLVDYRPDFRVDVLVGIGEVS